MLKDEGLKEPRHWDEEDEEYDLTPDEIAFVREAIKFRQAANEAIQCRGVTIEFVCPVCGGTAEGGRSPSNGHLHAHCRDCGIASMT